MSSVVYAMELLELPKVIPMATRSEPALAWSAPFALIGTGRVVGRRVAGGEEQQKSEDEGKRVAKVKLFGLVGICLR